MAVQLPSGLYNAYTEVLDSSPYLQFNLQQKARKQARDEALNQYFTELASRVNTAGVRQQDLSSEHGGINDDIELWKINWNANKDAIRRGGMAQQQHMSDYMKILRKIEQSKQRAKTELEIGKAKFEGKYDPDDDDIDVLDKLGKSIYDQESYKQDGVSEYGWMDLSPSVPDFDAQKQTQFWGNLTKNIQAGKVYDEGNLRTDKVTGQAFVPFKKMFSPSQIRRMADEAGDLVAGDKSARKYYSKILDSPDSDIWEKLNNAYQSVYGKDKFVSTPQQAAQADAIIRASVAQEEGEEVRLDRDLMNQRAVNNIYLRDSLKDGGGKNATTDFVQRYKSAVESGDAQKVVDVARELFAGNGSYTFKDMAVNRENMGATLTYTDPDGIEQKTTFTLDDPNVYLKLARAYQKITGSDAKLEQSIFQGKKDYTPGSTTPTFKRSDLLNSGKGWTEEKINQAVKAGKIKVQ